MNKEYRPLLLNIAFRYSNTLAIAFLALMYCGPIPILLLLTGVFFFIKFWSDKMIFLYCSRIPPRYDFTQHAVALAILPFAIYPHLIYNIWVYGQHDVFPTDITEA